MTKHNAVRVSGMLNEDQVIFFIGNEAKPSIMEALCRRFRGLNFDHAMNALWMMEHKGPSSVAPGVRAFWGKLAGIREIKVAIGISKSASHQKDAPEKLFFLFLTPYEDRFGSRVFKRAASRLFGKPNVVARLLNVWSPAEVLETLRLADAA